MRVGSTKGSLFVEVLLVAPLFVGVLASVFMVSRQWERRILLRNRARVMAELASSKAPASFIEQVRRAMTIAPVEEINITRFTETSASRFYKLTEAEAVASSTFGKNPIEYRERVVMHDRAD